MPNAGKWRPRARLSPPDRSHEGRSVLRAAVWPVPAEFGVEGYFFPCERHFVYLRRLGNGGIGNVTILHVQMHQIARFKDDFA